jgi:hypothetical protein
MLKFAIEFKPADQFGNRIAVDKGRNYPLKRWRPLLALAAEALCWCARRQGQGAAAAWIEIVRQLLLAGGA